MAFRFGSAASTWKWAHEHAWQSGWNCHRRLRCERKLWWIMTEFLSPPTNRSIIISHEAFCIGKLQNTPQRRTSSVFFQKNGRAKPLLSRKRKTKWWLMTVSFIFHANRDDLKHKHKRQKHCKFAVCAICEELDSALRSRIDKQTDIRAIQKKFTSSWFQKKRLTCNKKIERAASDPSRFFSSIMDEANQSAVGLPNFVSTKMHKEHLLNVRFIELLIHEKPNKLYVYTMTEEHETGVNRDIKAIYRFTNQETNSFFFRTRCSSSLTTVPRKIRPIIRLHTWHVYCTGAFLRVLKLAFFRLATRMRKLISLPVKLLIGCAVRMPLPCWAFMMSYKKRLQMRRS